MSLGMSLIFAFVGLIVIMVGSGWYYAWVMEKMLNSKVRDLDTIRSTQMPPNDWRKGLQKKLERGKQVSQAEMNAQWQQDIKRLDGVIKFSQKTTLMEDEQTREGILRDLDQIRREWQAQIK